MKLLGTIVNLVLIALGGTLGTFLKKGIPKRFQDILLKGMALCVIYIGISGLIKGKSALVLVISVAAGGFIGELIDIDGALARLGEKVQSKFKTGESPIAEGFVTATLLFGVGAMAIVGSLQCGLSNDHSTIITKSVIDCVTAVILASQLGFGVILSGIPIFIYQGAITLLAGVLAPILSEVAIAEMTCSGSLLILAIGLNMLGLTKLKVANYLPAILIAAVLAQFSIFYRF